MLRRKKETKGRRRGKIMKKSTEGVGRCLGLKLRGMVRSE
jgi:hypothetical protein